MPNRTGPGGVTAVLAHPLQQAPAAPLKSGSLAFALASLAELEFRMGDWRGAYCSAVESLRVAHSNGNEVAIAHGLALVALVEACLGRERACRRHGERALAAQHANDTCQTIARWALGLLELGLGRPDAAVRRLEPLTHGRRPLSTWAADLTEALIRRGDHDRAADMLAAACAQTADYAARRALERCRGLLATDKDFERHFASALDCGPCMDEPFELARTELCLGQRLRRAGRRIAAREHLRAALSTFELLGAAPWAESAHRELGASAAIARRRVDSTRDELTTQERQVARIVAEGATNRETAARLFVTEKTIETHLGRIYRKLGVRSRTELARRLAGHTLTEARLRPAADQPNRSYRRLK